MVSLSQVTSREGWAHDWVKDCSLVVGFLTAGAPVYLLGSFVPETVEIPDPVALVTGAVLYLAAYALVVLSYAFVDERFAARLPAVLDPTPNFRGGLIPAVVVVPSALALALWGFTLGVPESELILAPLWVVGCNVLGFLTCLFLARSYGARYN